jgi:prophage regulatory protein
MRNKTTLQTNTLSPTSTNLVSGSPVDRLIRLPEVLSIIPISRSKLYQEIHDGNFPAPQKIGKRISVWRHSLITSLSYSIAI